MRPNLLAVLSAIALAGCASSSTQPSAPEETVLTDVTAQVVIARGVPPGRGPIGIGERFGLEGSMVAFVSLQWPAGHQLWGEQKFESRWYSGDRLVIDRVTTLEVRKGPYHLWSNALPFDLGVGPGRYELYADGKKLAETSFTVVASPAPRVMPPAVARPSSMT